MTSDGRDLCSPHRRRFSVTRPLAYLVALLMVTQLLVVTDLPIPDRIEMPPGGSRSLPQQETGTAPDRAQRVDAQATSLAHDRPTGPPESRGGVGAEPSFPAPVVPERDPGTQRVTVDPKRADPPAAQGFVEGRSVEDNTQRTARSTDFANPDGTRTKRFFSQDRYVRGTDGSMVPIDPTWTPAGSRYRTGATAVDISVAASADDAEIARLTVGDGVSAAFGVEGAAGVTASVDGTTARYKGVRYTRWMHGVDHPFFGLRISAPANRPEAGKTIRGGDDYSGLQPFIDVVYSDVGAEFGVPSGMFNPPVTNFAKGKVVIRATNWGQQTWTASNGYRMQVVVFNSAGTEVQRVVTPVPQDTASTWNVDVPVEIGPHPLGSYTAQVTMMARSA